MKLSAWLVILTAALIVVVAGVAQASLLTEATSRPLHPLAQPD